MAPISQLAVLGFASAVLAIPHNHAHKRHAHPGAPPAYGNPTTSSEAAPVSSSAPAGYSSASAPAGYGSSSSSPSQSFSYSFSGVPSSGYAGPTGGYANPTGYGTGSSGYAHPTGTGSYSGSASYSTCTETSTLIYRSSTEYSTYYVTHTVYPSAPGSSADAGSSSAATPTSSSPAATSTPACWSACFKASGITSQDALCGNHDVSKCIHDTCDSADDQSYWSWYDSFCTASSSSTGAVPAGSSSPSASGDGTCVPDVTVTTTEKSTVHVTVGASTTDESTTAASTTEASTPSGGYPGSWEPAPSASTAPSSPPAYTPAPSSAAPAPSSAPANTPAPTSSEPSAPSTSASPPSYGGASGYGGKRGVNYNDAALTNMFASSGHIGWAMNWESDNKGLNSGIPYIPTLWGADSMWTSIWDTNAQSAIDGGAKWFFGPNEPDMPTQADLTPDAAAALWKQYMEPYAGQVKLVAPAVTNGQGAGLGLDWLDQFMTACSDCTIDAIGQHWYWDSNDSKMFKSQVQDAIDKFGKPVWVNEFGAVGSDAEKSTFLEDVMSWMDSNDSVL